MVRRRRDEPHARSRVPRLRHPRIHFRAGELPAFARLRALRHLDLNLLRACEVKAGHAEPPARHLLDRAVLRVTRRIRPREPLRVFAAFAGVRLSADAIHRNRQRLVRLTGDRAVAHRARFEPLQDRLDGLHFLDGDCRRRFEIQQPAQRTPLLMLVIHLRRILLENIEPPATHRRLQFMHRRGVKQMLLAILAPLIIAASLQRVRRRRAVRKCHAVPHGNLLRDLLHPDALDARRRPSEVFLHHRRTQPDRLENLCAAVRLHRADSHLRRHFHHAFDRRLREILARRFVVHIHQQPLPDHVVQSLKRQIRIHRSHAVADEQREVMHLTRFARLQHQPDARPRTLADEVMMQPTRRQQRRNRRKFFIHATVRNDEDIHPSPNRRRCRLAHFDHRLLDARRAIRDWV